MSAYIQNEYAEVLHMEIGSGCPGMCSNRPFPELEHRGESGKERQTSLDNAPGGWLWPP